MVDENYIQFFVLALLMGLVAIYLLLPSKKKAKLRSTSVLPFFARGILCVFFINLSLMAAEQASLSRFVYYQQDYELWGFINPAWLYQRECVDETLDNSICNFISQSIGADDSGPTLAIVSGNSDYILRVGQWPFQRSMRVSKHELELHN